MLVSPSMRWDGCRTGGRVRPRNCGGDGPDIRVSTPPRQVSSGGPDDREEEVVERGDTLADRVAQEG